MRNKTLMITMLLLLGRVPVSFAESLSDEEAMALGRRVLAVKTAFEHPEAPESLEAIRALGNDSRYYVMVRGWVIQHLQMAESYMGTSSYRDDPVRKQAVDERIAALKKALRAIDLE